MRKNVELKGFGIILIVLCAIGLSLAGCSSPGETSDEINVRHQRVLRNDLQQIQDDVDAVFMLDKPSRISDKPVR